jgi:hypothetical protein
MLAVVAVSSALATPAHHGNGRGLTINVVERATSDTLVDNAPTGDSVGDTLGFGNTPLGTARRHARDVQAAWPSPGTRLDSVPHSCDGVVLR